MTHHFTDMSSQHSNLEKGMEHSDHMKQIRATLGIYLIFENKSIMSEVDWKPKVGCFLPRQVLDTSRRLQVDLGSLWYQVGLDWHTKVAPKSIWDQLLYLAISHYCGDLNEKQSYLSRWDSGVTFQPFINPSSLSDNSTSRGNSGIQTLNTRNLVCRPNFAMMLALEELRISVPSR